MTLQFLIPHIKNLIDLGYDVELACTNVKGRIEEVRCLLSGEYETKVHELRLKRSPFKLSNINGYFEMKKTLNEGNFDLVWTNEPTIGLVTRLCAKKYRNKGLKIIYIAHGFHFYKSAPIKNWLLYYPVERVLSRYTDVLITINKEDFTRAKKSFKAGRIEYIPGVGVDTKSFSEVAMDRLAKRKELGVSEDSFVVLSVGELNGNKNHETIIRAIAKMDNPHAHYLICGQGPLEKHLYELIKKLKLEEQVKLLGYRKDIPEICKASDVFAFPSKREGLGLAALEAMASGLPIVTSNVQGIVDYSIDGETGYTYSPNDVDGFSRAFVKLMENDEISKKMSMKNIAMVERFDLKNALECIEKIYARENQLIKSRERLE